MQEIQCCRSVEYVLDAMDSHVLLYKKLTYFATRVCVEQLLGALTSTNEGTYSVHTSCYLLIFNLKKTVRDTLMTWSEVFRDAS